MSQFKFPEPVTVIRENGDSVVELRQGDVAVGELNVSAILKGFLKSCGIEIPEEPTDLWVVR